MNKKGVSINIGKREVPIKLIFHCVVLVIPLFTNMWLYALQFLFLSPIAIIDSIGTYNIYGRSSSTCHVYRNYLDFIFDVIVPTYRHIIIMFLGGYRKWHGVNRSKKF